MSFIRSAIKLPMKGRRALSMFESKNRIAEIRAKYYSNPATGVDNPTYLKEPQAKYFFALALGGLFFGVGNILYGLTNMMRGVNKVQN